MAPPHPWLRRGPHLAVVKAGVILQFHRVGPVIINRSGPRVRPSERHVGRDGEHPPVVRSHQLPLALMDHPVVPVTQKNKIVEIGGAAVYPVHDVVSRG